MASGDTSANLKAFWSRRLDAVIAGEHDPDSQHDPAALEENRQAVLTEQPVVLPPAVDHLGKTHLTQAIKAQGLEVKRSFDLRRETGRPAVPGARGDVKHVSAGDYSKLLRMEADMTKRFGDKLSAPMANLRPSRVDEQSAAGVTELIVGGRAAS